MKYWNSWARETESGPDNDHAFWRAKFGVRRWRQSPVGRVLTNLDALSARSLREVRRFYVSWNNFGLRMLATIRGWRSQLDDENIR